MDNLNSPQQQIDGQAITKRDNGEWVDAVIYLENAFSLSTGAITAKQNQQLETWRSARDVIQKEQPRLMQFLEDAQKAYSESPQTGKYDTPLASLENAAKTWQRIEERINKAEGGYPADLLALQTQIQTLRDRATLAYDAASSPVARDGLVKIQAYTKRQGTDAALTALEQDLIEQVRGQIPQLLGKAEVAEQTGDLTEALDLLRQANTLEPNDQNIQRQFIRLGQRKQLEDRLQQITADCQRKLSTNSYKDAVATLRQGIDIFLEPGAGLLVEAESTLRALLQIVSYKGETAFAEAENWREAQTLLTQLTSIDSPMVKRVLVLATQWLETSRSYGLRGIAASTAVIEDKLKGHRAARVLLDAEPHNAEFIQQFTATKLMVINQLNESATHRLERGAKALEDGDFDNAHKEAERVETEIYGPVAQEFEGFFAGEEIVTRNRDKGAEIIKAAKDLEKKNRESRPLYNAACDLFFQNKLNEAQEKLDQIPDIAGLLQLKADLGQLREKLAAALKVEVEIRQRLENELAAAYFDLANKFDRNTLQERHQILLAFPNRDLKLLPQQDQRTYNDTLKNVQVRIEELQASEKWYSEGQIAWERQEYKTAIYSLEQAKSSTPQNWVTRRIDIQKLLDQINHSSTKRFEDAKRFLLEEKYDEAFNLLLNLQADGEDREGWLRTAQAGQLFFLSRKHFDNAEYELAETNLQETLRIAQGHPPAFTIRKEANSLLHNLWLIRIEQIVEKADLFVQDLSFYNAEITLKTEYLAHLLSEQYPLLSDSPKKFALIVKVKQLLATIEKGHKLLGMIQEAESFLSRNMSAEAWRVLGKVLDDPDNSPVMQKIKKRAESVMESKKPSEEEEYEYTIVFCFQKIRSESDPEKTLPYRRLLQWAQARKKFDKDYEDTRIQSKEFSEKIRDQIEISRQETLKSMRKWEWLSIFAAFVAFGFLAYAGFFVIQWREPLTYLSTLPALLTGISAPFIHNHYKRTVIHMNAQYTHSLEQWKAKEAESNGHKKDIFSAILNDSQFSFGGGSDL